MQAVRRRGHLASLGVATDDVHIALLEFANGMVASLENSWVLPRDLPLVFDFRAEFVGEKGYAAGRYRAERHVPQIRRRGIAHADISASRRPPAGTSAAS